MSTSDDLTTVPGNISILYLPDHQTLSKKSLEKGLNYYLQGYIHNIKVSQSENATVTVSCRCWRSMRKGESPHSITVDIDPNKNCLSDAYCSCKAGSCGHCSHIVGLLKCLQGLKLHNISHAPALQSCTSLPQQWNVPRGQRIAPVPVNHVVVARPVEQRKRKPILCQLDLNYQIPQVSERDLQNLQKLEGSPLHYMLKDHSKVPKITTPLGDMLLGSTLSYQTRDLKSPPLATENEPCGDLTFPKANHPDIRLAPNLLDLNNYLDSEPDDLEAITRDQTDSTKWRTARQLRNTASQFADITNRKSAPSIKFLQRLFGQQTSDLKVKSLEYGRVTEAKAKEKYLQMHPNKHIHKCGLIVNRDFSFLGASPDAKICSQEGVGIMEVKCPYTARNLTIDQACKDLNKFCLEKSDAGVSLKEDHPYYTQVQGQLLVTQSAYCDFVVYTHCDMHVQTIKPNIPFMKSILQTLSTFYKNHAIPFIDQQPKIKS